jgi:hypothetical protein
MYDRHQKGKLSEYFVAYKLTEMGFDVIMPTGNPRYDLSVETASVRYFIQVKSSFESNGEIKVSLRGNNDTNGYHRGEVDIIAIHNRVNNEIYYVPISEVSGKVSICLRTHPPKCYVSKLSRFTNDYVDFPLPMECQPSLLDELRDKIAGIR